MNTTSEPMPTLTAAAPRQKRALIIGASRGLGAAMVRLYAAAGWEVHATLRKPPADPKAAGLPDGVRLHPLEMRDHDQAKALGGALNGAPLDLLIVAAATFDKVGGFGNGPPVPEEEVFDVNVDAPMRVAEAVFGNLRAAAPSKLVFMSSAAGIRAGGRKLSTYGRSKAKLNDLVQAYAGEWAYCGVIGISLHPGWVSTDMGGARAPLTPEQSAADMGRVISLLTPEHCGMFLDHRGNELPL